MSQMLKALRQIDIRKRAPEPLPQPAPSSPPPDPDRPPVAQQTPSSPSVPDVPPAQHRPRRRVEKSATELRPPGPHADPAPAEAPYDLTGALLPISAEQQRQYREAAQSILARSASRGQTVLAFFTVGSENDADTVPRLAIALADEVSGNVALVDGAPRRPAWPERLERHHRRSTGDATSAETDWRKLVCETTVPNLHVLLNACPGSRDALDPASSRLVALLEQLGADYRLVLVDAGTATQHPCLDLARACDGAYLIVRLHQATRQAAQEALGRIEQSGLQPLGCLVTGA